MAKRCDGSQEFGSAADASAKNAASADLREHLRHKKYLQQMLLFDSFCKNTLQMLKVLVEAVQTATSHSLSLDSGVVMQNAFDGFDASLSFSSTISKISQCPNQSMLFDKHVKSSPFNTSHSGRMHVSSNGVQSVSVCASKASSIQHASHGCAADAHSSIKHKRSRPTDEDLYESAQASCFNGSKSLRRDPNFDCFVASEQQKQDFPGGMQHFPFDFKQFALFLADDSASKSMIEASHAQLKLQIGDFCRFHLIGAVASIATADWESVFIAIKVVERWMLLFGKDIVSCDVKNCILAQFLDRFRDFLLQNASLLSATAKHGHVKNLEFYSAVFYGFMPLLRIIKTLPLRASSQFGVVSSRDAHSDDVYAADGCVAAFGIYQGIFELFLEVAICLLQFANDSLRQKARSSFIYCFVVSFLMTLIDAIPSDVL